MKHHRTIKLTIVVVVEVKNKKKTSLMILRKPKKNISFHHFSRSLPISTHVFVVKNPPSPPTPLLIAEMEENHRKVSSSTTPSFSILQAILDLSEKKDEYKREEAIPKMQKKKTNRARANHDSRMA